MTLTLVFSLLAAAGAVIFIRRRYRVFIIFGSEGGCERKLVGRTCK